MTHIYLKFWLRTNGVPRNLHFSGTSWCCFVSFLVNPFPPHFLRGPSFLWGLHGTRNGPPSLAWGDPTPAVTFHIGLRVREILQIFAEISEWLVEWRWEVWIPCNHSVVPAREGESVWMWLSSTLRTACQPLHGVTAVDCLWPQIT